MGSYQAGSKGSEGNRHREKRETSGDSKPIPGTCEKIFHRQGYIILLYVKYEQLCKGRGTVVWTETRSTIIYCYYVRCSMATVEDEL